MILHVFNSSLVSGPETLVLPNLKGATLPVEVMLLQEERLPEGSAKVAAYARSLGFLVHEIPVRGRFDFRAVRFFAAFLRDRAPAIAHAHGPKASLFTWLACRMARARTRLLTTHHGVRANDQSAKLRFFESIYEKLVIPRYDACLTVCTSDREVLRGRGISPDLLLVHLNGVDRRLIESSDRPQQAQSTRREWSSVVGKDLSSSFLIGVVGRLSPEKQHDRILKTMKVLFSAHPDLDARLLCFGSGPLEAALKEMSGNLAISDRVHWMGYRNDIASEMAGLDVLLSLSSAEGLPINVIEAGWSATPVVAQAVDGIRDVIESEKTGLLLEPGAPIDAVRGALARLGHDKALAERLARALQQTVVERFSRNAWLARLNEIYARFAR